MLHLCVTDGITCLDGPRDWTMDRSTDLTPFASPTTPIGTGTRSKGERGGRSLPSTSPSPHGITKGKMTKMEGVSTLGKRKASIDGACGGWIWWSIGRSGSVDRVDAGACRRQGPFTSAMRSTRDPSLPYLTPWTDTHTYIHTPPHDRTTGHGPQSRRSPSPTWATRSATRSRRTTSSSGPTPSPCTCVRTAL